MGYDSPVIEENEIERVGLATMPLKRTAAQSVKSQSLLRCYFNYEIPKSHLIIASVACDDRNWPVEAVSSLHYFWELLIA